MANIEIFRKEKIGEIRTITDERNEPWFCLSDVCKILGLGNPSQVKTTLKSRGVITNEVSTPIISQGVDTGKTKFVPMNFIDEPNLYKCIFQSRKQEAEIFQDWICEEVIPSIRKTGSYSLQQRVPQTFAEALRLAADLQEQNERQQAQLLEQAPKVEFYDDVVDSGDALYMSAVAKTLNLGIGRNSLFKILRENNILRSNNEPYQEYVDRGWFRCIESKYSKPNGKVCVNITTVVLQKGLDGIRKLLKKNKYVD